jgi:hypothetical protein
VNCGARVEPWRARPVPFCRGFLRHDDLVHQRDVGLHVEDLGGQFDLPGDLAARRAQINRAHGGPVLGSFGFCRRG